MGENTLVYRKRSAYKQSNEIRKVDISVWDREKLDEFPCNFGLSLDQCPFVFAWNDFQATHVQYGIKILKNAMYPFDIKSNFSFQRIETTYETKFDEKYVFSRGFHDKSRPNRQ